MAALRRIVLPLSLIAVVSVAALFVWRREHQPLFPDTTRNGSTILVYEIDEARLQGEYKVDPNQVAEALRRRFDAADLSDIIVRSVGDNRVEITIPRESGDRMDETPLVKDLIPQVGTLELRIVANADDDQEVFDSVQHNSEELKRLRVADSSRAPPAPRPSNGKTFTTGLGHFTYSWVELSPAEVLLYGLGESDKDKPFWKEVERARIASKPVLYAAPGKYRTNLFYSRDVQPFEQLPPEEHDKKYEYFVLCRDPERDEQGQSKAITGKYLKQVYETLDPKTDEPAVGFELDDQGAGLLAELSKKNVGWEMAIVLDDRILSAPNIQDAITKGCGIIHTTLGRVEVQWYVLRLRSGSLAALLKPQPVSETTVEPRK